MDEAHPKDKNTESKNSQEDNSGSGEQRRNLEQAERSYYLKALAAMPENAKFAHYIDGALTVAAQQGISPEEVLDTVSVQDRSPEQKQVYDALQSQVVACMKSVSESTFDTDLKGLEDFRKLNVVGADAETLLRQACESVSSELDIPVESLQTLAESHDLYATGEHLSPVEFPLSRRVQALSALLKTASKLEENARFQAVNFDLESTDAIINNLPADHQQQEQWRQIKALDLPKSGRIKVIPILGGQGLSMNGEVDHIQKTLDAAKGHATVKIAPPIDNNTLTKEQILAAVEKEYASDDADTIIFYASTHGFTRSFDTPEVPELRLGLSAPGSTDDLFHIQNESATNSVNAKSLAGDYDRQAYQLAQDFLAKETSFFQDDAGHPVLHHAGEEIQIGDLRLRLVDDVGEPSELVSRLATHLRYTDLEKGSISTDDLGKLQAAMRQKYPEKEIIYILDNCFSGSATNDTLAALDGTRAILSASSENEPAHQNSDTSRGYFMEELFSNLELGYTLGESFVRADIKLNHVLKPRVSPSPDKEWQNPAASVREANGRVLKVSSIANTNETSGVA